MFCLESQQLFYLLDGISFFLADWPFLLFLWTTVFVFLRGHKEGHICLRNQDLSYNSSRHRIQWATEWKCRIKWKMIHTLTMSLRTWHRNYALHFKQDWLCVTDESLESVRQIQKLISQYISSKSLKETIEQIL